MPSFLWLSEMLLIINKFQTIKIHLTMEKVFYAVLISLLTLSCSDDEDKSLEEGVSGNFKTVKVVLTRISSNHAQFNGGTILTVSADKSNLQYDERDFDSILGDEEYLMLAKLNEPLTAKQEFIIKQKSVKVQIVDAPQLLDTVDPDTDNYDLTTKIEIFVNEKLVKSETYVFSDFSIPNIIQYKE